MHEIEADICSISVWIGLTNCAASEDERARKREHRQHYDLLSPEEVEVRIEWEEHVLLHA